MIYYLLIDASFDNELMIIRYIPSLHSLTFPLGLFSLAGYMKMPP